MEPCSVCGRPVAVWHSYVVRLEVLADPTPAPVDTSAKQATVDEVIASLEHYTAEEAMDDVYRKFEFRVCRECQKLLIANPLGLPRRRAEGRN